MSPELVQALEEQLKMLEGLAEPAEPALKSRKMLPKPAPRPAGPEEADGDDEEQSNKLSDGTLGRHILA